LAGCFGALFTAIFVAWWSPGQDYLNGCVAKTNNGGGVAEKKGSPGKQGFYPNSRYYVKIK